MGQALAFVEGVPKIAPEPPNAGFSRTCAAPCRLTGTIVNPAVAAQAYGSSGLLAPPAIGGGR